MRCRWRLDCLPSRRYMHWDVDHLIEAAEHWHSTADRWESVYGQLSQQAIGMDWHGQARDALIDRTTADRAVVTQKADQLREASLTARKGAGDISAAQRSVLYKVDDAHQAGFVVGEDLSLTDTQRSRNAAELAARQAQAQALATDIRSSAAQLLAVDSEVGAKLTATAGDVGSLNFNEKPIAHDGKIQPRRLETGTRTDTQPGAYGPRRSQRDQKPSEGHRSIHRRDSQRAGPSQPMGSGIRRLRHRPPGANTREQSVCYRTVPASGCATVTVMDRRWKFGRLQVVYENSRQ